MIEGIKFDVTVEELKTHLLERIEHHDRKSDFYEDKAKAAKDEAAAMPAEFANNTSMSISMAQQYKANADRHTKTATLFRFVVNHLVPGETYRLAEHELSKFELI